MKLHLNHAVPVPLWQGRQLEKIVRETLLEILDHGPMRAEALAKYIEWPEKFLKPHIRALQRKGRIQISNGILFTKKSPSGTTLTTINKNFYASRTHEYNDKIRHRNIEAPQSFKNS